MAADTCPAFGTEFARGRESSGKGLWLNFATPAQCIGKAVQWEFCYYVQYTDNDQEVWLRVYRKGSSDTYDRVVEDKITRRYQNSGDLVVDGVVCDGGTPPYCCENMTVNHPIQENDIIGVCMRDAGRHNPLFSQDEDAPAGYTVYQYGNTDDCNKAGDINSFEVASVSLIERIGFGLHAHLSIIGKLSIVTLKNLF